MTIDIVITIVLVALLIGAPVWLVIMAKDLEEHTQGMGLVVFAVVFVAPVWLICLFILKAYWATGFWMILSSPLIAIAGLVSYFYLRPYFRKGRRSMRGRNPKRIAGRRRGR